MQGTDARVGPDESRRVLTLSETARATTGEERSAAWIANHKRAERILREGNLPAIRWWKFVTPTEAAYDRPVYVNLASRLSVEFSEAWEISIRSGKETGAANRPCPHRAMSFRLTIPGRVLAGSIRGT